MLNRLFAVLALLATLFATRAGAADVFDRVEHHYADNDGVRIHYVTLGRRGPLVVMLHGFPDFWYTWRDQMTVLSRRYRVVAIDQRGYNLSDAPKGVDKYSLPVLASDVAAVIHDLGEEHAVIVGHDWGGAVSWLFAAFYPSMTDALVILNLPHPRGLYRELRENPAQVASSAYARAFQEPGAENNLSAEFLSAWVADPSARARYLTAFQRSDFEAMLNYYRANYPRAPYDDPPLPNIDVPVLMIHGLADPFLLAGATDGTWQWVNKSYTFFAVPGAGHFVQQDASAVVTRRIALWLAEQRLR